MSHRKERYGRLTVLLSGCVTQWARTLVLKCVKDSSPGEHEPYPWELKHFLQHNRGSIMSSGRKMKNLLNTGRNGDIKIEDWDLQLCCFVLQKFCPLPTGMLEDINYVTKVRNQLCHAANPELPDHRYEKSMSKLNQILLTGLAFIGDNDLKTEIMKEFDFCRKGLFSFDMNLCTDTNKKWRQQEADLGEIKQTLDQVDKEELMAIRRLDEVQSQTVPVAAVDVVLTGCTDDSRSNISDLLLSLFDEKLSKHTDILQQLSQKHLQNIREAVSAAMHTLVSDGKEIISAKKRCVRLTIQCDTFVALASLLEECVNGKMTEQFQPVAEALRAAYGNCVLRVAIYEGEFWKCIMAADTLDEKDIRTSESSKDHGNEERKGMGAKLRRCSEYEKGSAIDETGTKNEFDFKIKVKETLIENASSFEEETEKQHKFEITEKCKLHTDKLVECFCRGHDVLCCTICVVREHANCAGNIVYIPNEVRATDVDESPDLKLVTNKSNSLTERTIHSQSRIKLNTDAIEAYRNDTKSYINQLQQEMNERFEQMKCDIDVNMNDFKRDDTNNMEALELYCSSVLKTLARERNELDEVMKSKNKCQLFITLKKQKGNLFWMEEKVKDIENKNEIKRYRFQPDAKLVDLLQEKKESLGRIVMQNAKTYTVRHVSSIDITAEEGNDSDKCCISGITVLSPDLLVVSDSENKQIKLINIKENKIKSSVSLPSSPADMAGISGKEVIVALPVVKRLQVLASSDKTVLKMDRSILVDQECNGVAHHDNMLFVSFIPKSYMRPSTVYVLDMSGKALKCLYQTWTGSPCFVNVNSTTNTLYISDWYNGTVTSLSLDGKIKAVFSNKSMQQPNGIIHNSEGYVYVCGRKSNNISQLSADCKLVQVLEGLGDVCEPVSLAFSKTDQRMYVGMNNSKVIKAFTLI